MLRESSPFDSSPFSNSPRLFWQGSENDSSRDLSASPKRSSIENLKKASRVKNSSMFAREQKHEYDPALVQPLDRPLAAGRPLSVQVQGNAYGGSGLDGLRQQNDARGHHRGENLSKIPTLRPAKTSPAKLDGLSSYTATPQPARDGRTSPTKSSLTSHGRFAPEAETSLCSDDDAPKHALPRTLRRHAKSVTFDAAPPTINEYEMVTPDPSSVASGSREGSYESDLDDSFEHSDLVHDDSFDASLEDTEKTPVVLPEDWRHMTPEAVASIADTLDDPFGDDPFGRDTSPAAAAQPNRGLDVGDARHGSGNSDGSVRPLPPLPGTHSSKSDRHRRDSSIGLAGALERASGTARSLPVPPQAAGVSKSDILGMRDASLSLDERFRLVALDGDAATPTQESGLALPEPAKNEPGVEVHEIAAEELQLEPQPRYQPPQLENQPPQLEYQPPRISRESILRRVQSRNLDDYDMGYDSVERSYGELADLDPDFPIPSREASSNFDEHPTDPAPDSETDSVLDIYSMTELTTDLVPDAEGSRMDDAAFHDAKQDVLDDDASQYSTQPDEAQPASQGTVDSDGPRTPKGADAPALHCAEKVGSSPEFQSFDDADGAGKALPAVPDGGAQSMEALRDLLRRPVTPDQGMFDDEPATPESVIRHPIAEPEREPSPVVPEPVATIKAPGAKLKTRPSLVAADAAAMAAARRQVSGEHAPPVLERSPKRVSLSLDMSSIDEADAEGSANKENMMLDLPVAGISDDLGFGLDKEFDHIIEAQKVAVLPLPACARFPPSSAAVENEGGQVFAFESAADQDVRAQKGYLMRQNTKVVVASSRQFSDEQAKAKSAPTSPRKASGDRKPAWTTEPWNGKVRRKSVRTPSGVRRAVAATPAPALPGHESAVGPSSALDEAEDGVERGKLFVKVVAAKDLDLPLPKSTWPTHTQPAANRDSRAVVVPADAGQRAALRDDVVARARAQRAHRAGV